ncbi:hypothetical protein FQN53_000819 [Emmonsiellopsis sp. PD_33]|nr:hypothetical protein FQN53_000819 [Emmonsiellopsis sp. PD_33]
MVKPTRNPRAAKGKAPTRGTPGTGTGTGTGSASRPRPTRSAPAAATDELPLVYRDMLAEAEAGAGPSSSRTGQRQGAGSVDDRPVKRRKVGERSVEAGTGMGIEMGGESTREATSVNLENDRPVQTVYDIDASDDDESEMEWEDVEFAPVPAPASAGETQAEASEESLQITLEKPEEKGKQRATPRRKPVTGQEKKWRLDIHKMHLLSLLGHVQLRNLWCNDEEVQHTLKRILPKHTIMCLNPKENLPQFTRSTTFADGLKQACEAFRRRFKVTAPGMKRPYWMENPSELRDPIGLLNTAEIILSKDDFRKQATILQGSRDLGAQLFCALLRAVDVDARLVCSLQVLPFTGVARGMMPSKPEREYIVISEDDVTGSSGDAGKSSPASGPVKDTPPPPRRRLGQPRFSSGPAAAIPKPKQGIGLSRGSPESPFPIFWVEVFNKAMQKWVPVDPIVTNTVGKPTKFEPPAADRYNNMSYVIAFEDDASARDVTKRYTKSFNSKTRKLRVESTKNGEEWWEITMKYLERPFLEDRDQLEIGELTAKAAAEMMPRNVQDFKDHPIYALERHLRRNEVIFPKREIGKVGLSKVSTSKKNPPLESVYRRGDVHVVKSADGWYRLGREVRIGEQPLKRVPVARGKGAFEHREELSDYEEDDEPAETPMYAIHQTDSYKPPPVVDNRVPKNAYGNIDVYTPNMVPEGGFHLKNPEAARAARILGIDYADAVTGFQFKGRHGTAVVQGIVASVEYQEALNVVLGCLEDERVQAEQDLKTAEALRMWKLLLLKLRVAERVRSYAFEGEEEEREEEAQLSEEEEEEEEGGGFFLQRGQAEAQPTRGKLLARAERPTEPGGFIPEDEEGSSEPLGGGFLPAPEQPQSTRVAVHPASSIGLGVPRPQPQGTTSRYTLIVTPKDTQTQHPRPSLNQAERNPPQFIPSTATSSHQPQQPQGAQSLPDPTPTIQRIQPATEGSTTAPISISTSSGERSISAEEISGLPDLVHEEESASEVDQSSMLSHDPEDEDAEPEWLLSD